MNSLTIKLANKYNQLSLHKSKRLKIYWSKSQIICLLYSISSNFATSIYIMSVVFQRLLFKGLAGINISANCVFSVRKLRILVVLTKKCYNIHIAITISMGDIRYVEFW